MWTYEEALAFIHGAYGRGRKLGLSNMRSLLRRLGNPQEAFPAVHIAGTNGKGSVCAFLQAALRVAGYRTGLYTSPFLERYNERMRIDGVPIADAALAALTEQVAGEVEALRKKGIRPTEFEIGTAIAFVYFAKAGVDIAVIEVGLGGRLDPTNILLPQVTAIASIGLDHTRTLGDTVEKVAREKAGIAKPGVPMVLSRQVEGGAREVVADYCKAVEAPLYIANPADDLSLGLAGAHQAYNAGVAREVLRRLRAKGWRMPEEDAIEGFRRACWPGRLEWVDGTQPMLLDGAHNPQGAETFAGYVRTLPRGRTVLLTGMLQDKDWQGIVRSFAGLSEQVVTVAPGNPRALGAEPLAEAFHALGCAAVPTGSVPEALAQARLLAGKDGRIIAAGSLYLVGELRTLLGAGENTLLRAE